MKKMNFMQKTIAVILTGLLSASMIFAMDNVTIWDSVNKKLVRTSVTINQTTGDAVFPSNISVGGVINIGGAPMVTVPIGGMIQWFTDTAPSGFLLCYGQALSRTTYSALFAVIGTTFGSGDGSTTFNLPDLRGRLPLGQDDMGGSSANRVTDSDADDLGGVDGDETKTIAEANLPIHSHAAGTLTGGAHTHTLSHIKENNGSPGIYPWADSILVSQGNNDNPGRNTMGADARADSGGAVAITGSTASTGSGTAMDVMNPFITVNYIIKY